MKPIQNQSRIFFLLCLLFILSACLPSKKLTVGATATLLEEVAKASYRQSDLRILREGMPAYLMLIDGMVQTVPDNEQLLIAAAQSYSSFASLFWAATCWANWIRLNLDSMEAMSELPRVEWMMKRVLELDEGFYYGGPHLFMGIWLASRPKVAGGDLGKAQGHFLKAMDLGQGKFLMAYIYYAKYYAQKITDKELFVSTLKKFIETPASIAPELT